MIARSPEIELFRTLLASHLGIDFGRQQPVFLETRLRRRMTQAGARSLYEYYRMVAPGGDPRELELLVNDVAIHETSFFRNPAQFELLQRLALPDRVSARLRSGERRLQIWSAGCSTGQEPYSIAITLAESVVLPEKWDLGLLATDVASQALDHARRGRYTVAQVDGVSAPRRQRFFERRGDAFTVRPWARRGLEFRQGNVLAGPPRGGFDVVFCRNLMIYFDRQRQKRLAEVLEAAVTPGGYLFLGHTESLAGLSFAFSLVSLGNGIVYQRQP
ncbi:MAG TPA: protein-glutamate O-methyltransferase CheR [Vicinamibacteria bacterium]